MTMMATQHPVDDIVAEAALLEDDFTETKQQQEHSDESHAEGMMIASSTTKEEEEGENRTGTTIEARTYDGSTETFTANTIATNTPASQYTPPRSSLATDSHLTPIASIKRPLKRTTTGGSLSRTPPVPHTPSNTTMTRADSFPKKQQQHTPLTPMHKIKAVHRSESDEAVSQKVDVLFSPVVQFLHENGHEDHEDDVSMTRLEQADNDEFNPWQFIQSLPPYESVVASRPPVTLPPRSLLNNKYKPLDQPPVMKKTLVLDLDETLVHCTVQVVTDADFVFPVQFHGEVYQVYVKCRPYLQDFLAAVAPYFEIVVFTASQKVYADALLNILDPEQKYIDYRLFRESCLAVEGNYLKDLNVLGRDLAQTVLVDNSPHAFGYQIDNGIPIESWFDCPDDRELLKLRRFLLQQILPAADVRIPIRTKFRSHELVANAPPLY